MVSKFFQKGSLIRATQDCNGAVNGKTYVSDGNGGLLGTTCSCYQGTLVKTSNAGFNPIFEFDLEKIKL